MPDLSLLTWMEWLIVVLYFGALSFIFLYSIVQLLLVLRYRSHIQNNQALPAQSGEWPKVTIQLPVYNERYVAQRLIDQVCQMSYPKELLEIQVLDDSTDNSTEIITSAVRTWRAGGVKIQHIQRKDREGFKAGALRYGTALCKGEFIAIFDADFMPPTSFLKDVIPHFQNEQVGVVQTRWTHLNQEYSLLTRLQAFGLDAHFTVEQGGRFASNSFINFNGTAGVWRKACIEDAGGWSSDTLTEDLDLSYRAQLKGWQFIYREDVEAPAELPVAMPALKTQQYRWTKGAAECTVKNLGKVWRKQDIPWITKWNALFHLMNSFIFISVFVVSLLSIAMLFIKAKLGFAYGFMAAGSLFLLSLVFLTVFYWTSFKRLHPNIGFVPFLRRFFLFLSMSMGLSLHNAIAVAEGYFGRKTPFIRTPKFNIIQKRGSWKENTYVRRSISLMTWLELALALLFSWAILIGVQLGNYGLIPFHLLLVIGFGLVGITSARHNWSLNK